MIKRYKKNGELEKVRPSFNWDKANDNGFYETASATGQITEDARNILEEIRDKQMLQCDVRSMIQSLLSETRRTRRILEQAFNRKRKPRKTSGKRTKRAR